MNWIGITCGKNLIAEGSIYLRNKTEAVIEPEESTRIQLIKREQYHNFRKFSMAPSYNWLFLYGTENNYDFRMVPSNYQLILSIPFPLTTVTKPGLLVSLTEWRWINQFQTTKLSLVVNSWLFNLTRHYICYYMMVCGFNVMFMYLVTLLLNNSFCLIMKLYNNLVNGNGIVEMS